MTDRLDEICKRAEAATPGPWETWEEGGSISVYKKRWPCERRQLWSRGFKRPDEGLCQPTTSVADVRDGAVGTTPGPCSDADFIAHARADIPWLIAEVERLSAKVDDADRILATIAGVGFQLPELLEEVRAWRRSLPRPPASSYVGILGDDDDHPNVGINKARRERP